MSEQQYEDDDSEIDLDLLGFVKRRYLQIMLGIFVGASLATVYFFQQVPIYQSSFAVLVGQRTSELATTGSGNTVEETGSISSDILATHIELLGSRKVLQEAVSTHSLPLSVGQIKGNLTISKSNDGASVLHASFRDTNPERATEVLDAIYQTYESYIGNRSRDIGTTAAELIAKSLVECEAELNQADADYREYIASVPALVRVSSDGSSTLQDIHGQRLENIEDELSSLRKDLSDTISRRDAIKRFQVSGKVDSLSDFEILAMLGAADLQNLENAKRASTPVEALQEKDDEQIVASEMRRYTLTLERQKLLELMSKKDKIASTVGIGHPSYQSILLEIQSMEQYIARLKQASASRENAAKLSLADGANESVSAMELLSALYSKLENEIEDLRRREQELVASAEVEAKLAKELQVTFLNSNSLKSTLDRAQKRYDVVLERLQEINLTNNSSGFSTDLLLSPFPADFPIWPSKTKIAAIGLLAGAMLGFGLALLAELTDRTFRDPSEVEKIASASIFAHVPKLNESKAKEKAKADSAVSHIITTFHTPRSSDAETFRVLRTSVLFMIKVGNKKVLMNTSPSPSDGKSTTIANLAVSLAQTGKRILLLDADLRRPTVARMFGLAAGSEGLADFLLEECDFGDCLHASEQDNLTICPNGRTTSEPSELLESDRLNEFLAQAREQFDLVLVDSPPLLAVADPAIISNLVDGCLLTVRIEKNNRTLVERACDILAEHGRPIDGIVVNSTNSTRGGYGYSTYNYYGNQGYGYVASYRSYYAADPESETNGHDRSPSKRVKRRASTRQEVAKAERTQPNSNGNHKKSQDARSQRSTLKS